MKSERELARQRLERLALLLDSAVEIPGLGVRVGLDSLIGLLPGVGDALGALASSWIIGEAARLGAPRAVLFKMVFNVGIDTLIGVLPVLGDLFDIGWKANLRNVRLLSEFIEEPRRTVRVSRLFVWGLILAIALFILFLLVAAVLLLRWLWLAAT